MTNLQNLILTIREDIPDMTTGEDPHLDGRAFSLATILRWINDAGDLICLNANVIQDWYALPTASGQDVYELPDFINSVEQVWYNLLPLDRSSEQENLFTVKRSGSSWWFSPHNTGITPRLFLFPAPSESAATTQLNGSLSATATSATVDSSASFNVYGYFKIDDELVRYASVPTATTFTNLLRGQGGTTAVAHADNAVVTDQNLMFKCFRAARHVTTADDVLELPRGLYPLVQLYAASKVLSAEQDKQSSAQLFQLFMSLIKEMSAKPATQGLRQGIQVKLWPDGGTTTNTKVYLP